MAQQRVQVGDLSQPNLRPAAAPVDTFVQTNGGQGLKQLAAGLAGIVPTLNRWSDNLAERDQQSKLDAGRAKARELGGEAKTLAAAVKDGKIPEAANPWFRAGLQEQIGRVAADQWGAQLTVDLANDPAMQNSTNVADFDSFVQSHRQKFMEQNSLGGQDRFFTNGFGSMSDAYIHNERNQFAADVARRVVTQNDQAVGSRVYAGVRASLDNHIDAATIAEDLTHLADEQYRLNPKGGERINRTITEAVVRLGKDRLDSSFVRDILSKVKTGVTDKTGNRLTLDTTQNTGDAIRDAEQWIGDAKAHQWDLENRREKHEAEPIMDEFIKTLSTAKDPAEIDMKPFIERMAKADPTGIETLKQLRRTWVEGTFEGNPRVEAEMYRRVFDTHDITMSQLADSYVGTRQISRVVFQTLANELQQQAQSAREGRGRGLLGDPDLAKVQQRVRGLFVAEFGQSTAEQRARAENAVNIATMAYVQGKQSNQFTTPQTLEDFIHRKSYELLMSQSDEIDRSAFRNIPQVKEFLTRKPGTENVQPGALPDWKKVNVIRSSATLGQMEAEVNEVSSGARAKLSDGTKTLLRVNRVKPDRQSIMEFIQAQKRLANQ